jgi:hypothetical protein
MKEVPVTQLWWKSSYSNGNGGECLEIADLGTTVGVRDSKQSQGPRLALGAAAWAGFVAALREGRLG